MQRIYLFFINEQIQILRLTCNPRFGGRGVLPSGISIASLGSFSWLCATAGDWPGSVSAGNSGEDSFGDKAGGVSPGWWSSAEIIVPRLLVVVEHYIH